MLYYNFNESFNSSLFFIQLPRQETCIMEFKKLCSTDVSFNDDFLQTNIMEMVVVNPRQPASVSYCKALSHTIKGLFDQLLEKKENLIIYICIAEESPKHKLIRRYVAQDQNDHFQVLIFKAEKKVFVFFINEHLTNTIMVYISLAQFFKNEHGIEFAPQI